MYKILEKRELAPAVKLMTIEAPRIAKKAKPGQFIILRVDEQGERIPLTIADMDSEKGSVTIIFQEVGGSTLKLGQLNIGDSIADFVGPLGEPTHIEKKGTVVCVGGGIGIAPIYPIAKGFKQAGNKVISIIGARNREMLILTDEMDKVSDELYITSDDGSIGEKGLVTHVLQRLIDEGHSLNEVVAIGPVVMMKFVAEVTRPYKIPTVASLNPIMIDGTGMCGGCRVIVGEETKFACVDGPEFDAHLINFDLLMNRQRMYHEHEREPHKFGQEGCKCRV